MTFQRLSYCCMAFIYLFTALWAGRPSPIWCYFSIATTQEKFKWILSKNEIHLGHAPWSLYANISLLSLLIQQHIIAFHSLKGQLHYQHDQESSFVLNRQYCFTREYSYLWKEAASTEVSGKAAAIGKGDVERKAWILNTVLRWGIRGGKERGGKSDKRRIREDAFTACQACKMSGLVASPRVQRRVMIHCWFQPI